MPATRTQTRRNSAQTQVLRPRWMSRVPNDRFFRHLVSSMRNGVIAIHRNGTLALMNDEAYRIFCAHARCRRHRQAVGRAVSPEARTGSRAVRRLRADDPAQPRGASPEGPRPRHRLHPVAGARRRRSRDRRGGVLQGPHAGRADGGARTAARPARVAWRNGRRHCSRTEEPARRYRGHGRAAASAGARLTRRPIAAGRHPERSEARQRDRRGDARVRPARFACRSSRPTSPRFCSSRSPTRRARFHGATSRSCSTCPTGFRRWTATRASSVRYSATCSRTPSRP